MGLKLVIELHLVLRITQICGDKTFVTKFRNIVDANCLSSPYRLMRYIIFPTAGWAVCSGPYLLYDSNTLEIKQLIGQMHIHVV